MKFNIYKIIALFVIIYSICYSQNDKVIQNEYLITVNIKNGMIIESKIRRLHNWGFYIEDGRGLSYKVIRRLTTPSKSLIDSLQTIISDLEIIDDNSFYTADFTNASIPIIERKINRLFRNHIYVLNFIANPGEQIEMQLLKSPIISKYFIGQLAYSIGWWQKSDEIHNIMRYSFGVGLIYSASKYKTSIMMNTSIAHDWVFYRNEVNDLPKGYPKGTNSVHSPFITFLYQYYMPSKPYIINIGIRYYFLERLPLHKNHIIGINIGLGWSFDVNTPFSTTF